MASASLSQGELNFIKVAIACVDFIKQPLKDILILKIKPADLYKCLSTNIGFLRKEQLKICLIQPPGQPNYDEFDVTLIYTLIRNLCSTPTLSPTKGWGKDPDPSHVKIGDDIERLRLMRNKFAHSNNAGIPDVEFKKLWKELKSVIHRVDNFIKSQGCSANYEKKLKTVKQRECGFDDLQKYKTFLEATMILIRQERSKDEPELVLRGANKIVCGEEARFEADVTAPHSQWSIVWQRVRGSVTKQIDISEEKYQHSTTTQLIIDSVCKEDEGEYQAVLYRETNGNKRKIESNAIFLIATGEFPAFQRWEVSSEKESAIIHYKVKEIIPKVTRIEWSKNGEELDLKNNKYQGGGLFDISLKISSLIETDSGEYTCTLKNAVGSTSKSVIFDHPSANISSNPPVDFGAKATLWCKVSSIPPPTKVEWQESADGITFSCIDIKKPEYLESDHNHSFPSLVIQNTTFEDILYYRLQVWNGVGCCFSNTVYLDVKGSPPNVTVSHETYDRSVKLIAKVFSFEKCHDTKEIFWAVNEKRIDTEGWSEKYSKVSVEDPSLTIQNINQYDAGSYTLTAINVVGSTTSDAIEIDVPEIKLSSFAEKNGSIWFTLTIRSIPALLLVRWSKKEKKSDEVQLINVNSQEFRGSSCSLPHPVLVIQQKELLEKYWFQIDVTNHIGTSTKIIQDLLDSVDMKDIGSDSMDLNTDLQTENDVPLGDWYEDEGAGIMFATLFEDLADHFPPEKFEKLKDIIQNSEKVKNNNENLNEAKSARDCFRLVKAENLFSQLDVTFMQFLLRRTECNELERKCAEFAKVQNALGFYETQPENGFKNVEFHVLGDLSNFNFEKRRKLKNTIAAIVKCPSNRVILNGYRQSESFIAIVSVEVIDVKKLINIGKRDKNKLVELNIDYISIDFIKIYVEGDEYAMSFEYGESVENVKWMLTSASSYQETYSATPESKDQMSSEKKLKMTKLKDSNLDVSPPLLWTYTAILELTVRIDISGRKVGINRISCVKSDRLWFTYGDKVIKEIDDRGYLLRELAVDFTYNGCHTMTKDGNLLFIKDGRVQMLTVSGEVRQYNINVALLSNSCIHSSRANGDIFISDKSGVVKQYDKNGRYKRKIDFFYYFQNQENRKQDCITQNQQEHVCNITINVNGDIILADNFKRKVVALGRNNQRRFTYCLPSYKTVDSESGFPIGLCNDLFGHVLVGFSGFGYGNGIHVLDINGSFKAKILSEQHLMFHVLCVDDEQNLYVGNEDEIRVYSFLSEQKR